LLMDGGGGGGGTSKLEEILTKIKYTLKTLGYIVCVIFMIIGGYQMITASGDPKQFEKGRNTLLYAAIGFVVILLADNIVDWIKSIIS
jgi:type IV secretory pathway VirB2 component (pilin)